MRIVIADDSKPIRDFLTAALKHLGHDLVGIGADGREAENLCRIHKPDLAILDMHMGDYGGDRAAPNIVAAEIKVMMLTSKASARDSFEAQGIPVLIKPVMVGTLKNKIAELFAEG